MCLDIDVHHGNGTQDIFYEDPSGEQLLGIGILGGTKGTPRGAV